MGGNEALKSLGETVPPEGSPPPAHERAEEKAAVVADRREQRRHRPGAGPCVYSLPDGRREPERNVECQRDRLAEADAMNEGHRASKPVEGFVTWSAGGCAGGRNLWTC